MAGPRKKRHTGTQLLLRRAVSRMGRIKSPTIGNHAIGGSTLYDVNEPRPGITVLPSIARDSQLVHIMQSSLENNNVRSSKNTRSRRTSRLIPNRTADRLLSGMRSRKTEEPIKEDRSGTQTWRKQKLNEALSDRSRASSIGYPSSWNFEITKDEIDPDEAIHSDIHSHQLRKSSYKSIDTSVQCSLKRTKKGRSNILVHSVCTAETQTGPLERSSRCKSKINPKFPLSGITPNCSDQEININNHNSWNSNFPNSENEEVQKQRAYSGGVETQSEHQSSCCLCKVRSNNSSTRNKCNNETCPYKSKNYGGYTPSETTVEKSSALIVRPSRRFNRIEKMSLPPGRKANPNKNNEKCLAKGQSENYKSESKNLKLEGSWRLQLATKDELKSYELSENCDICPFVCQGNKGKGSNTNPNEFQEVEQINDNREEYSSRKSRRDYQQELLSAEEPEFNCQCERYLEDGNSQQNFSSTRNVGFQSRQNSKESLYDDEDVRRPDSNQEDSGSNEESCDCECPGCLRATETSKRSKQKNEINSICRCSCPVCERLRIQDQITTTSRKYDMSLKGKSYFENNSRFQDALGSQAEYCDCDCPGCNRVVDNPKKSKKQKDEICRCNCPACHVLKIQEQKRVEDMNSSRKDMSKLGFVEESCDCDCPGCLKAAETPKENRRQDNKNNSICRCNCPVCERLRVQAQKSFESRKDDMKSSRNTFKGSPTYIENMEGCDCDCPGCMKANESLNKKRIQEDKIDSICKCSCPVCERLRIQDQESFRDRNADRNLNKNAYLAKNSRNTSKKSSNMSQNEGSLRKTEVNPNRELYSANNARDTYNPLPFICKCCPATTQTPQSAIMSKHLMQDVCSDEEYDPCKLTSKQSNLISCSSSNSISESEKLTPKLESRVKDRQSRNINSNNNKTLNNNYRNKKVQCSCQCPNCGKDVKAVSKENEIKNSTKTRTTQRQSTAQGKTPLNREIPKRTTSIPRSPKEEAKTKALISRSKPKTIAASSRKDPRNNVETISNLKKKPDKRDEDFSKGVCNTNKKAIGSGETSRNKVEDFRKAPRTKDYCSHEETKSKATTFKESSETSISSDGNTENIANFCNNETCSGNICGQCTITPAKKNSGDAMVNMLIDEKCNVNQIIDILHKTVAGLEQQKKLLCEAVAGNTNGKNSDSTKDNTRDSSPYSGYSKNDSLEKSSIPNRYGQQEIPSSSNKTSSRYASCYRQGRQQPRTSQYCPQQCPKAHCPEFKSNPLVVSCPQNGARASVRILSETQYDYSDTEEPEINNTHYYRTEECCPDIYNNTGVLLNQSKYRKSSGCAFPFENSSKTSPSCTYSEIKRKTLQNFKPTKSFFNLFDMALIMKKNRQIRKNNVLNCNFSNRKSPNHAQILCQEQYLKSREHFEYLGNKNPKYLDVPIRPNSYERNILKGFEKQKADYKDNKTNIKSKSPYVDRESDPETDLKQSLENVRKYPRQNKDPFDMEELGRNRSIYTNKDRRKGKSSRQQRKQSEQSDLSPIHSNRDISDCKDSFTEQCECDCYTDRERDMRFLKQTSCSNLKLANKYHRNPDQTINRDPHKAEHQIQKSKCFCVTNFNENNTHIKVSELKSKCHCINSEPKNKNHSGQIYNWKEAETKKNVELRPSVDFENKQKAKARKIKITQSIPLDGLFPGYNKKKRDKNTPRQPSEEPIDLRNQITTNLFPCLRKRNKKEKELPMKPNQESSEDLENNESRKRNKSSQEDKKPKKKSSNLFSCFSRTNNKKKEKFRDPEPKSSNLEKKESSKLEQNQKTKRKSSNIFPCFNKTNKQKKEKKPEPKPSKDFEKEPVHKPSVNFEQDQKPKKQKSSNLFPCFKKTNKVKKEKPKDPELKTSDDIKQKQKREEKSSGYFPCLGKTKREPSDEPIDYSKSKNLEDQAKNEPDFTPECCECDDNEVKVLYDSSNKFKNRNDDIDTDCDCECNSKENLNLPHESHNNFFSMLK